MKTVTGGTPDAPVYAVMLAANAGDPVADVFVQTLVVADVVRAGRTGTALEQVSLLSDGDDA